MKDEIVILADVGTMKSYMAIERPRVSDCIPVPWLKCLIGKSITELVQLGWKVVVIK